ncbi:MAG: sulfatase [Blastopirellula sp.]|nr:MAG: sulfatase [Blastopirellula sp.]
MADQLPPPIQSQTRRSFLTEMGLGFGSVALSAMLQKEALAEATNALPPAAKAKSVIWLFMIGGASHMESFDPKPMLNKHAGKTIEETPFKDVLSSPYLENERVVAFDPNNGFIRNEIYPLQIGYKKRGQSGLEISDWFPHLGEQADDMCLVRSMWTEDSNHGAQLQFHTGRHRVDGFFPTIGSWVNYGLGSLNENLPEFVVMGNPLADCCGGREAHRANYLGPQYDGVPLKIDPNDPLPYAKPAQGVYREEQQGEFELLNQLNQLTADKFPDDDAVRARIRSFELAYRMQTAVPEVVQFSDETAATHKMYGLDQKETKTFGQQMLAARRLVERGVRFVQVYHGSSGGAGRWDSHKGLKNSHSKLCKEIDQPVAGLLKDLKQRGLLDETIVVWASEFGRTPGSQHADGRDHHPFGFTVWMAGGGIKGGIAHGKTDELGFHAVENRHYVTDIHATILHQLGLDPHQMVVPGRKRLEKEIGKPIHQVIA